MTSLEAFLVDLVGGLPEGAGSPEVGVRVEVSSAGVELPIETWIGEGGRLHACAPRNRMVTGFQLPIGRLAVGFERGEP
jgi:hypothetical protein